MNKLLYRQLYALLIAYVVAVADASWELIMFGYGEKPNIWLAVADAMAILVMGCLGLWAVVMMIRAERRREQERE